MPASFAVSRSGGRASITIPLAISDDEQVQVGVEIRLWPGHWAGHAVHELKFAVIVFDLSTGQLTELFDRRLAAPYIEPIRPLVMPCVRAAAEALIEAVQPAVIYRATWLTRPPPAALTKHDLLTATLERCGYEVRHEGADSHGRRFWLMCPAGGR